MARATEYVAHVEDVRRSGATSSSSIATWSIAAVFAMCALVEAVVIARLIARPPITVPAVVPITFESEQAGEPVVVDGKQIGVTPLQVKLTPAMRSVQVRSHPAAAPTVVAARTPAADRSPDASAAATAQAAARERRGGLRLSAPVELQVLEGERVLGSTVNGPILTTAGRHELDFVNSAIGYRSRHVVDIKPGQIIKMAVVPPDGRVSVNASPWAQVWINGALVGDTPIANLSMAAGETRITFRHPQLGEQTQKVVVQAGTVTRVSATFAR